MVLASAAPLGAARLDDSIETPFGWTVVAVSFALIAIGNASHYVTIVALKPIAQEFDWPRGLVAMGYSLVMLGTGVGGIVMGRWSDRAGMTRPVAVGVVAIATGCWVVSTSHSAAPFLLAHGLLIGLLGNAALFGPLVANITRWFDRRRGLAVAIVASGQSLAGAMWTPLFRYLVDTVGWRSTYLWFAGVALVTLLPLSLVLRREAPVAPHAGGASERGARGRVLGLPSAVVLALLCAAIVGCCVSMAMPLVHLVAHASDLGLSAARGAEMLSLALAASVVSRISWGWASDRIGGLRTLVATSSIQALALLLYAYVDGLLALYLLAVFFGLGYGGIVPSYMVILREYFPVSGIGQRVGVVALFGTLGMAVGGWLGATIYDYTGSYASAFLTGFAFNVGNVAIVTSLLLRSRRFRPGGFASA